MKRATTRSPLPLLVASMVLSLVLAEIIVRITGVGPSIQVVFEENYQLSDNPLLEYELRPNSSYDGVEINSAGFRDREYPKHKPPGVFRIAAIGDSVTFGLWVPQRASFPRQLEVLLNDGAALGVRVEVLDFGVTGYNITQSVERLRTLALDYEPDLVLYGYVLNDPQADSLEGNTLRDLRSFEQRQFSEQLGRGAMRIAYHSRLFTLAALWVRQWGRPDASYARDTLTGNLVDRSDDNKVPVAARGDAGGAAVEAGDSTGRYFRRLHTQPESRRRFVDGITDLAELSRAVDVPVVVAIFPLFLSLDDYPLADVHDFVRTTSLDRGLRVVDLLPAYVAANAANAANRTLSVDFMHPSVYGHRIAARELARALRDSVR